MKEEPLCFVKLLYYEADLTVGKKKKKFKAFKCNKCPFCGSKAKVEVKDFARHFLYVVECTNDCCPASYMLGTTYDSLEEATLYWNRRVTDEET